MQTAETIAVGSELLLGGRLETNSLFLTERLAALGIEVRFKSVVGDATDDIAAALRIASRRVDVVIMTGGLGPTEDDCTRQAVARVTGRPLRRRGKALEELKNYLAVRGRSVSAAQLRQALIPSGAEVLPNPVGSAPGFFLEYHGAMVAVLPGVSGEAEQMFTAAVAPRLAAKQMGRSPCIERRMLHTFGLIEAEVDRRITGLGSPRGPVRLGLVASPLGVSISLTACTARREESSRLLDRVVEAVKRRLGPWIYAEGEETMEEVIGRHLIKRGLRLAVAESCTGGLIGHRLTQVPGSSAYFDRGIVSYSNEAKQELLGVARSLLRRHGAVSTQVAAAMARGIRVQGRADIGLSVTGIAGPGGGTDRKPVGLVYVGLEVPRDGNSDVRHPGPLTRAFRFHGDRETIKLRASQAALDVLRQWLVRTA